MQSKIKRRVTNAAIRHRYKTLARARIGQNIITASTKEQNKVGLPFSEVDLLNGLNAHGAHADELAQLSATETDF
ncbi:hypothetical protein [Denitrificimonas caeni]|uniref:hypothetical protein n=1 Tax=Denitrificimonas caeni TaxID=521720 RepID=UPI0003B3FDEF|nr:hypothetical protein [Denitrificimonas caeni]